MKREDIKQNIGLLLLIALFVWMYRESEANKKEYDADMEANKVVSVAYLYDFHTGRSSRNYYYVFIVDGKQVKYSESLYSFKEEECIGKFYKVIYSSKNPNHSKIFLDQEIVDDNQKIKAGF